MAALLKHESNGSSNNRKGERMVRHYLPDRRPSWVQKLVLGGTTVYVNFGEYSDGALGEVFIDVSKAGSANRNLFGAISQFVSVSIQYGMPLRAIIDNLRSTNFAPQGEVSGEDLGEITHATSILDLVGQLIEKHYLPGHQPSVVPTEELINVEEDTDDPTALGGTMTQY